MQQQRIEALARAMEVDGVDAFFAQTPITMGYLHGYHEHSIERFLTLAVSASGEVRLICPALSVTQAERTGIKNIMSWKDGEDPLLLFEQLTKEWDLRTAIVAVDDEMPAQMVLKMQSVLTAALFRPGQKILSELMRRKDADELALMRRAAKIADEAFDEVAPKIHAGLTENQVSQMLADAMKSRGGTPTFSIVGAGSNGAEPHHLNDDTVIKDGDVLILDFGCDVGGYQSDITRTVAVGHASDAAKMAYGIVFAAHMAARAAGRPGVPAADVDSAARMVIQDAGMGDLFFHRTGHGIGMRGHEEPFIIGDNLDELVEGDCYSIEPGVYKAGEFGIRIENIVTVVAGGCESLNAEPSPTLVVVGGQ